MLLSFLDASGTPQLSADIYICLLMGLGAHVELKSEGSGVFLGFLSCRSSLFISQKGPCCIPDSWKMEAGANTSASRSVCCSAASVPANTTLRHLTAAWPLPQMPVCLELTQVKILITHVETDAAQASPEARGFGHSARSSALFRTYCCARTQLKSHSPVLM